MLAALVILRQPTIAETLQKQVIIEPKFVEVSDKNVRDLGWSARLAEKLSKLPPKASTLTSADGAKLGLGATPSAETVRARLFPSTNAEPGTINLCGLITKPELQTILNSLGREQGVKVVSAPAIRIQSDEPANVQIPFQGGLKLNVVPRINADGTIGMVVTPETVELSKDTGGSVPVINDIPVLGTLFRNSSGGGTSGLMIVIEPRIIEVLEPGSGDVGSTVNVETIGTGDTIGHIADIKIENPTDQQLVFVIPPMVLESKSQKNQDYACPRQENVTLAAHETKTVPLDGVCVNRDKPPVGEGVTGDLVMNTGDPGIQQNPDSHIRPNQARDLLRICTSKYDAADKLQKDGALRDFPYKDKQTQKNIAIQWSTWSDPRISHITGARPATKNDLKKVVYKQLQADKPISPETRKKVDQGIDTIFEKVELTTANAKNLEEPETYAQSDMPAGTFEVSDQVSDDAASPPPNTQEKPNKTKKQKKDKGPPGEWSKPILDWCWKLMDADRADLKKRITEDDYNKQLQNFCKKSKHHGELEEQLNKAQAKINYWGTSPEERDKLVKERDELKKELTKLEGELEKDFQQTDEGKKALAAKGDVQKAAADAAKAEQEAGKYLDKQAIEEKAFEELKKWAWEKALKEVREGSGVIHE